MGNEAVAALWAGVAVGLLTHTQNNVTFLTHIVDLLKYPTAAGAPTDVLMDALRQRFPNVPELKGDLYQAVPWFESQLGAAYVAQPPTRPTQPPY